MTQQLDDLTLGGASTFSTTGYIQRLAVGQQASDFNVATGLDDAGIKGDCEVVGVLYPYGGINTSGAAQDHTIITAQANAYRIRGVSGGSTVSFIDCDTSSTVLETEAELRFSKTHGMRNDAGGTEGTRQAEEFDLGALAALDTAGGVLDIINPMGVEGYLFLFLDITTAAAGACTVDAGVGTTGIVHDDALDGLDVNTATGQFSSYNSTNRGTNGVAGIKIGAAEYITISKATGAAASLAGRAWCKLVPVDW